MRTVYPLIHDRDIYDGFNADAFPSDLHGWNDHEDHFRRLAANSRLIVEIGSWKGRSAISLCRAAPGAEVVCVDTWLGAQEMWVKHDDPERYGALRLNHGWPNLYYEFLANVVRAGMQSQITPMPMPSSIALRFLAQHGVRPDLIYIDGSHAQEDVEQDIRLGALLNPRVICGDDFGTWPGVRAAVISGLPSVQSDGDFWWAENQSC